MKIVILDSETVSRNDVSLEGITVLGESIVYGFTPNEQVAEKIGLKGPRTRQLLNELVNMELLACIGTTKKRRYIKV